MNIHGARRVWAGAGLQRAAYRGGDILRVFPAQLVSPQNGSNIQGIWTNKKENLGHALRRAAGVFGLDALAKA